MVRKIAF